MAIGSLAVRVSANTRPYNQGMRRTRGPANDLRAQMGQVAKRAGMMTAAMAAAGAAITTALVRKGLDAIDTQAKLARQIGGTMDGLRGLQIAADDAGVSQSVLERAVENLNSRLGEAQRGSGAAAEALERLGLDAEKLSRMDIDERMAAIADRMDDMGLSSQQAADELRQLGIRQGEVVRLMQQGGDAIRDARQEVDDFGLSVSEVDAAQIEAANDAMSRIGRIVEHVRNELAINFAPILQGVANLLSDTAKESGGFGDAIADAVDFGVDAFAFLADAVEGVRRTFKLAGQAIATFTHMAIQGTMQLTKAILEGPTEAINALIRQANRIPKIDIPELEPPRIVESIESEMRLSAAAVELGKQDMQRTLNEPMPSEGIKAFVADSRQAAKEAAEATVEAERGKKLDILKIQEETNDELNELREEEAAKERERIAKNLARVRQSLMSEREAEVEAHEEKMEWLRDALEEELLTEAEFKEKKEALEEGHMDRLGEIRKRGLSDIERFTAMSYKNQAATVANQLENMTANVANQNKAMFNLNKVAGIANAIINTHEGISKSLSAYPMPLAAAMAASHAAAGFAQVNAIKSQSFSRSGGGSAPSQTGTTPTTSQPGAGQAGGQGGGAPQQQTIVNLQGEFFDRRTVSRFIESLNEGLEDGQQIMVGS